MKEVSKEEFKQEYIDYRVSCGKPYEKAWDNNLELAHRNDIRYFIDDTFKEQTGGIIIDKLLENDNRVIMRYVDKASMNSITGIIEEAIQEAKHEQKKDEE